MGKDRINLLVIGSNYKTARKIRAITKKSTAWNVTVHYSANFKSAVMKYEHNHIDVLLISNSDDGLSQLEILKSLRDSGDDRPMVIISHTSDDNLAADIIKAGADDYLRDDMINHDSLMKAIGYALERAQMRVILKKAQKLEHHMAYHDALTNLPNRKLFMDRLHQALTQSLRTGMYVGVMYLDLDEFKEINDTLGHRIGDLLLKSVADRLLLSIRKSDTAARLGGDEFMVILNGITGPRDAARVARKINSEIGKIHRLDNYRLQISVSIGISIFPWDGDNVEVLMRNADKAMYRSKEHKTGYQFFHRTMNEQVEARIRLEHNLIKALERNELVLHYQPILQTKSNVIHGLEALLRWNHPEVGMMYPMDFMPVAEESELIRDIESWVISKSFQNMKAWNGGGHNIKLSINISNRIGKLTGTGDILENLHIDKNTIDNNVIFELNEPTNFENIDEIAMQLKSLKDLGAEIALDNFGTGICSLSMLNRLPLDIIKFDKTLIEGHGNCENNRFMLETLINYAHNTGLRTVAGGIETTEQDSFADSINCDLKQGFLYSKPLPAEKIKPFLFNRDKAPKADLSATS